MVNDPPAPADEPTLFGGPALTYYGRWTYKYEEAARQGAAGALLIHTDASATYPWQVVQSSWSGTQYSLPPQAGQPALGDQGVDDRERGQRSGQTRRQGPRRAPQAAAASAASRRCARRFAPPRRCSSDRRARPPPTWSRSCRAPTISRRVVYTAHWDHFGMRDPQPGDAKDADRIFNGAYDNASGMRRHARDRQGHGARAAEAGALDLVRLLTAEESGLLGSETSSRTRRCRWSRSRPTSTSTRINYLGPTNDMVQLGVGPLDAGPDAGSVLKERGRTLGSRHASGARVLLPLGSFPVRQGRGAGAVD